LPLSDRKPKPHHVSHANATSGETPAVLWVGVDQGFYRKHGLNVETIFMRSGPLAMSALASAAQRFAN
jgi:ABC-type nitrate/sulfonate/bicarbonate transport system substrate-binding protein